MKYFKKLEGEKVYLSPISSEDVPTYCEWLNDLEVAGNLIIFDQQLGIAREKAILEDVMKNDAKMFAVVDSATDKLIGNGSIFNINQRNQKAELGIFIGDKTYWNKGYGSDAVKLLLDFGFNILNLNNIMLEVFSFNKRAIAAYKKVGFKTIGSRREAVQYAGFKYDEIYMDILAEEFESPFVAKFFPEQDINKE